MGIHEKLSLVQLSLHAPKGQYNSFGKYSYRSCEDILEALKEPLKKVKATVTITDSVEMIGGRYYVKAAATFHDVESGDAVSVTAYAREDENKKGMDSAQITGTASSYARKYALNGLFLIDDNKDADARPPESNMPNQPTTNRSSEPTNYICADCGNEIKRLARQDGETIMTAEEAYKRSIAAYGVGLCVTCAGKRKNNAESN